MIFTMNVMDEKGWEPAEEFGNGSLQKILREDENGCKTFILKLPRHFHMDAHSHRCAQQHYVIQGTYTINNIIFREGSYQRIPENEEHGTFESENGATILVSCDPISCEASAS